jgi:hypothetical protein
MASNLRTRRATLDRSGPGVIMRPVTPFGPSGAGAPPPHAPDNRSERPPSTGRTGITIGILVVVLLALLFYFYWRTTGARDEGGQRPPPPRTA